MGKRIVFPLNGRATLTSIVYDRLRREIINAAWLPGQKLHIAQLCTRYEVGLSPMREALNRLSREGLVTQSDQRGFHVSSLSEAHLVELTKTRGWLNEIALRESIAHADREWEERLLLAHHRLANTPRDLASTDAGDRNAAWEEAHRTFHGSLIASCGSSWLIRYCEQLFDAADRYRHLSRLSGGSGKAQNNNQHRRIMEAALAGDADAAVRLMHDHFARTAQLASKYLESISSTTLRSVPGLGP